MDKIFKLNDPVGFSSELVELAKKPGLDKYEAGEIHPPNPSTAVLKKDKSNVVKTILEAITRKNPYPFSGLA